jgi:hypothetical protein
MKSFAIDGAVVSRTGDRLVVTYSSATDLTVNGQAFSTAPAPVVATFVKDAKTGAWLIAALATMRARTC